MLTLGSAAAGLLLTSTATVSAATSKSIHDFNPYPDGSKYTSGLTLGTDGSLYGVAATGGVFGFGGIYKVTPVGSYKLIHSFSPADGNYAQGPLVLGGDGKLYGVTTTAGPTRPAILFSVASNGAFAKVHTFGYYDDISAPIGRLAYANNFLYGVTENGQIYKSSLAGSITMLHQLNTATEGSFCMGMIYGPGGSFYAVCGTGGSHSYGSLIKISAAGDVTVLHAFTATEFGYLPTALNVGPDGNLWGAFESGGVQNYGVIYKVSPSGQFTIVANDLTKLGLHVAGPLVTKGDSLYGEIENTPGGFGRVFKVTTQGVLTSVYSFDGQPTGGPAGGLILGKDGNLYGTSIYEPLLSPVVQSGATSTAFKLTPTGGYTLLHAAQIADGAVAAPNLVVMKDGSLYGITEYGGKYDLGTLYKISNTGVLTNIYDFGVADPSPISLVQGPDGNLYGTTSRTVFKAIPGAPPATLYKFVYNMSPWGHLTVGSNKWIYGVTLTGGATGHGGVFRFNTSGQYVFIGGFPSSVITEQVTLANDGNAYGVDLYGPNGNGSIYRFTKTGAFANVYSFPTYSYPLQSLTMGADGKLYGISQASNSGIFAFNTATLQATLVHRFNRTSEGAFGTSPLTLGPNASLYGTTVGDSGAGIVYGFNPATQLFTTFAKAPTYVAPSGWIVDPPIALTFGPLDTIYCAVPYGGVHNSGQVFKVDSIAPPPPG